MARNADAKAEAIAIGMVKGAIAASKATGIPRRTISRWLAEGSAGDESPVVRAVIVATEEAIAERLWETMQLGLEEVRAGLLDPKARLSDKARALEVIASQWQLITGRATARTESANVNVQTSLLEGMDPEAREAIRTWILSIAHGPEWAEQDMAALEAGHLGPEVSTVLSAQMREADQLLALQQALIDPTNMPRDQILEAVRAIESKIGGDSGGN